MKTPDLEIKSFGNSLLQRIFFVLLPALVCFPLSPIARAADGGLAHGNTAEGTGALNQIAAQVSGANGSNNSAMGLDALFNDTTGSFNTAFGAFALFHNTSSINNTATGSNALFSNNTGNNNTAAGSAALHDNTTGADNTAVGFEALLINTDAKQNTAIGSQALSQNTTGSDNTAVGFQALASATLNGQPASGDLNTAIGVQALAGNTIGTRNTATGVDALNNNNGSANTASGTDALFFNDSGDENTASGDSALFNNSNGSNNTANGFGALSSNSAGNNNTADGSQALFQSTGSSNIAVGSSAGMNLTTGSNNIDIGAPGVAGESSKIRIGQQGTQNGTFIAGISGTTVTGSPVVVNSSGKLGVGGTSSVRFKEAVKPMEKASEAILSLKPVTFRYKQEIDPDGAPQFGLVAEQVEKVNPDLVTRDEEGKAYAVRYDAVNAMVLNEFLKEHKTVQELKSTVARQEATITALIATMKEQASLMRTLSNQLEASNPASVANNQ